VGNEIKEILRKAKDEALKIEARAEMSIDILEKIVFKHKPSKEDIDDIRKVIRILEGQKP